MLEYGQIKSSMKIRSYSKALQFLNQFIPKQPVEKFPGELWHARAVHFMDLLGNPQEKLKVIHIAGTSGKGSTSYLTSLALQSQGFKVGLILSPHIIDIRERVQINNQFISKKKFVFFLNQLAHSIEKMKKTSLGAPSYFEILVALAYFAFEKEKVDYAVVETGLGGLYDATNVIARKDKITIITQIDFDHTKILGNTLSKIAENKAGIIKTGNEVITVEQKNTVAKVLDKICRQKKTKLIIVKKGENFKNVRLSENETTFDFSYDFLKLNEFKIGLIGSHQAENCSLALSGVCLLSKRENFKIIETKLRTALRKAYLIARIDIKKIHGKKVILDGAHNPSKMDALIKSLNILYPKQKFDFLITFLSTKDHFKILKKILPVANRIVYTSLNETYSDWLRRSQDKKEIERSFKKLSFNNYKFISDSREAFQEILSKSKNKIVTTGSLYFLGEVYSYINKY